MTETGGQGRTLDGAVDQLVPVGLDAAEATTRLRTDGPNTVAPPPRRQLAVRVLRQLTDPLVALLLAAAVVTTALGDYPDTAVIVLVVLVNTVIGVVQEIRADRAVAALGQLAAPAARVVRDGRDLAVPAADLVRGDLVRVEAGDIVPADLLLVEANRLQLDESALSGESVPVGRTVGQDALAGTVVTTGRAAGTVLRTGPASALGRISTLVADTRPTATPLQRRLAALGRMLGLVAVGRAGRHAARFGEPRGAAPRAQPGGDRPEPRGSRELTPRPPGCGRGPRATLRRIPANARVAPWVRPTMA